MKRSEMVEVINDFLDLAEECETGSFSNKDKAEYIIGCCETWGMLPPPSDIEWGVTDTLMYVRYEHVNMDDCDDEQRDMLWEPED